MVAACLIMHGFGSCWLFLAFVDDMCVELISLNDYKKIKKTQAILYKHLCAIIEFQNRIKKLSRIYVLIFRHRLLSILFKLIHHTHFIYFSLLVKWSECYRSIFVSNLLWGIATMAVTLVSFQVELVE